MTYEEMLAEADSGPPLPGEWRHNQGMIFCGTIRVAVQDFDNEPSDERKIEILDWMVMALNEQRERETSK